MYTAKGKPSTEAMLHKHAALVKKIAASLKAKLPDSVEIDDLIQAGMIGLMNAVSLYENKNDAAFETYATVRVRGAMMDELRSSDWLPRSVRSNMRKVEAALGSLQHRLGRAPRESEIAEHLGLSVEEYQKLLSECGGHQLLYYEDFQDAEDGSHFFDQLRADEDADPALLLERADFKNTLAEAINGLPERERIIMGLYYEQDMNLKEMGAVLGVSESRVCQLHSQALARLRTHFKGESDGTQ